MSPPKVACALMIATCSHRLVSSSSLTAGVAYAYLIAFAGLCIADDKAAAVRFREKIEPILENYCYGCHGFGEKKGGRAFDEFKSDGELVGDVKLWHAVLKNVRSDVMPPADEARPTADERKQLFDWIEQDVFKTNDADPDPGRVTLRRLNRAEYRNTIKDLTGISYDTSSEFPPDDSGFGFDNVGDAMSLSPLLMEKYLNAAREIAADLEQAGKREDKSNKQKAIYRHVFVDGPAPDDAEKRDAYARKILGSFVQRAYRRPVNSETVDRLCAIAKDVYLSPGQTFESGIGGAIVAVLASPRFLFRVEELAPTSADETHPLVDEYSLASRLSYFLWSTMPDEELNRLAAQGKLREQLPAQVARMLKDPRSESLAENFAGQWLRARDVEHLDIDVIGALGYRSELDDLEEQMARIQRERERRRNQESKKEEDGKDTGKSEAEKRELAKRERLWEQRDQIRDRYRELRDVGDMFDRKLRSAMRDETEAYFDYIVREDRNVLELVDSNYTFMNQRLAKLYGVDGVTGDEMRRVELPAGSARGGVLTQATVLAATSNPNRTSPVKRGLFILDNILASPPVPPPPPDVPPLEKAKTGIEGHRPTVRELQEQHRRDPLCHACHSRMDPLGLALENFNALGGWRDTENSQPIDASGTLITGEKFNGIRELKTILKEQHRLDFYRCLTEKLLTYSLGRGLEYYDEHTVDVIVGKLDREHGKFSSLLIGIVESASFQRQRHANSVAQTR